MDEMPLRGNEWKEGRKGSLHFPSQPFLERNLFSNSSKMGYILPVHAAILAAIGALFFAISFVQVSTVAEVSDYRLSRSNNRTLSCPLSKWHSDNTTRTWRLHWPTRYTVERWGYGSSICQPDSVNASVIMQEELTRLRLALRGRQVEPYPRIIFDVWSPRSERNRTSRWSCTSRWASVRDYDSGGIR